MRWMHNEAWIACCSNGSTSRTTTWCILLNEWKWKHLLATEWEALWYSLDTALIGCQGVNVAALSWENPTPQSAWCCTVRLSPERR